MPFRTTTATKIQFIVNAKCNLMCIVLHWNVIDSINELQDNEWNNIVLLLWKHKKIEFNRRKRVEKKRWMQYEHILLIYLQCLQINEFFQVFYFLILVRHINEFRTDRSAFMLFITLPSINCAFKLLLFLLSFCAPILS